MALMIKRLESFPLKVDIAIPPENPVIKGFITAYLAPRSKPEMQELQQKLEDGEFSGDDDLLKRGNLFTAIEGLTNTEGRELTTLEDALKEVTEGPLSMYLTSILVRRYFEHFQASPVKNFRPSRGR
jgi:hypothetical protein